MYFDWHGRDGVYFLHPLRTYKICRLTKSQWCIEKLFDQPPRFYYVPTQEVYKTLSDAKHAVELRIQESERRQLEESLDTRGGRVAQCIDDLIRARLEETRMDERFVHEAEEASMHVLQRLAVALRGVL